jgi:hypothetical protein
VNLHEHFQSKAGTERPFIHSVTTRPWGPVNGDGNRDGLRVPNRLSLDTQVRALAERLLERFAVTVGDLRASARTTTPGAFYGHWKSRSRLWSSLVGGLPERRVVK